MISARLQPQRPICAHPHLSSTSHPKRVGNRTLPPFGFHQLAQESGLTVSTQILRLRPGFRLVLDLGDALEEDPGSGNSLQAPGCPIRLVAWFGSLVQLSLNNRLDYAGIDLGLNYFDLGVDQQSGGDVVIELK
ncbi:hypothetical protein PGT21_001307 [Puccinia graminis f. sp. tritici]|uniref:Uncharacterized protein n=1 Tax=Puccinia graminis f. sp. tritici TaxID=56615 RepID=A0A5B0QZE7_PUCGR|nr:hypothetical protein PGT21_001307 [Puccinia graminis f. sp. tritici]